MGNVTITKDAKKYFVSEFEKRVNNVFRVFNEFKEHREISPNADKVILCGVEYNPNDLITVNRWDYIQAIEDLKSIIKRLENIHKEL
jgi:hypothetical protein